MRVLIFILMFLPSLALAQDKGFVASTLEQNLSGPGRTVTVVLSVGDDGPGFPEEFLPRAFQRFSRPDASRNRDSGGSGLGLAIVKSLAEAHGGTARASNSPAGGAVVTVVIPSGAVSDPEGAEGRRRGTANTHAS